MSKQDLSRPFLTIPAVVLEEKTFTARLIYPKRWCLFPNWEGTGVDDVVNKPCSAHVYSKPYLDIRCGYFTFNVFFYNKKNNNSNNNNIWLLLLLYITLSNTLKPDVNSPNRNNCLWFGLLETFFYFYLSFLTVFLQTAMKSWCTRQLYTKIYI